MDHAARLDAVVFEGLVIGHLSAAKDESDLVDLDTFPLLESALHLADFGRGLKVERLLTAGQSFHLKLHFLVS